MIFFGQDRTGDVHNANDVQAIEHNYFSHGRNIGVYVHMAGDGISTYRFANNSFRELLFDYDEVHPGNTDLNVIFRVFNTINPIELLNNRWDGPESFAAVAGGAQVTQSGNVNETIPPVEFVDSGFPADFDYLTLELWTDVDSSGLPVVYAVDDYVTHEGQLYKALSSNSGQLPPSSPGTWQLQAPPPDDVRLALSSPFQGYGLLDNPANEAMFYDGFESGDFTAWSISVP